MSQSAPIAKITIKPALSTLVLMGALVGLGPILGVLSLVFQVEVLGGAVLALGALVIWASVATVRVTVEDGWIDRKVFWRTTWRVACADAVIHRGLGGDVPFVPALIVRRRSTGKIVGTILTRQFRPEAIAAFEAAVMAAGGCRP